MKIIAKTENGWLVDVSTAEIATVQGLSRVDKRFSEPKPGDSINISDTYDILANLSYDDDIKNLQRYSESLSELTNWLKIYKEKHKESSKVLQYQQRDRY